MLRGGIDGVKGIPHELHHLGVQKLHGLRVIRAPTQPIRPEGLDQSFNKCRCTAVHGRIAQNDRCDLEMDRRILGESKQRGRSRIRWSSSKIGKRAVIEGDAHIRSLTDQGAERGQVVRKQGRDDGDVAIACDFPRIPAAPVGEPGRFGMHAEEANSGHRSPGHQRGHLGHRIIAIRVDRGDKGELVRVRVNDPAGISIVIAICADRLYENRPGHPWPDEIAENRIAIDCTVGPPVAPRSPGSTREAKDVIRHRVYMGISDGSNVLLWKWRQDR